ncbi:MAG TPA: alternative ribosome rescue aminoacyl-tRNA hydrolase ArfB [Burkholderiaceae bacterium]|jgi:ribosome-associated protein|nr:alternative ribosome rescue aminoacyl-tRNA hydrolase ArfB [Burkholderiaceae bacterium]HPE00927.1 alternative ribosome rescue aminoacyl-tRNA hydrolase ArfB [Burkholderiaceae bacterium]HRZ01643.1 alternative ribosome rescue aminoacyl-tRNA hydrolase ArfB [Burkholderiaceae bacterium]
MSRISYQLDERELQFEAIRAQGAGGQNVNKVASAVQLRFDIAASTLPEALKQRLLARADRRLTTDGVLVIKAQAQRTQERNRAEAVARLRELIEQAAFVPRTRVATRPSSAERRRRLEDKRQRGEVKAARGPVRDNGG